jgi:SEC-C motif-containing protein
MSKVKAISVELKATNCYCKSGVSFQLCCQPVLSGRHPAKTAEGLMRSRYTAFCLHDQDYLLQTWHPSTRPESLKLEAQQQWLGLKVVATHHGHQEDVKGQVEFIARYKIHGRAYRLHESSDFVWQDKRWYYTQGTLFGQ